MKGTRKRIVLWLMTGLLMIAGLSMKGVTARAEEIEFKLVTPEVISRPNDIDKLENEDKGLLSHINTPENTDEIYNYVKFTLTERSWLVIDDFCKRVRFSWSEHSCSFNIYANSSLSKEVFSQKKYDVTYNCRRVLFYLEPGTYYMKCCAWGYYEESNTQNIYGYILPVSKVMSVSAALTNTRYSAVVTATSPVIPMFSLSWAMDELGVDDINANDKWPNSTEKSSFEVSDNGIYTIRMSSEMDEWKDYPVSLTINITGVVKCEHDFSVYDIDAEGHMKKCSKCGKYETGKKEEHTCDEGTVTTEPTTLKEGVKTFKCVECEYVIKTEKVPKLESHPYHTILTDSAKASKYRVIVSADMGMPAVEYYKPVKNVATVTIPAKVKIEGVSYQVIAVAANAFKNNTKLKKVTIGSNVDTIGSRAFYGCKNLKNIVISTKKLNTVGNYAIKNINSKAVISVPKSKRVAYKKLFTKKTGFKNTMTIK